MNLGSVFAKVEIIISGLLGCQNDRCVHCLGGRELGDGCHVEKRDDIMNGQKTQVHE
jgi:hypothetical protein